MHTPLHGYTPACALLSCRHGTHAVTHTHVQVCGYRGPVLMTYPTFAMAPIMLEDYVKVRDGHDRGGGLGGDRVRWRRWLRTFLRVSLSYTEAACRVVLMAVHVARQAGAWYPPAVPSRRIAALPALAPSHPTRPHRSTPTGPARCCRTRSSTCATACAASRPWTCTRCAGGPGGAGHAGLAGWVGVGRRACVCMCPGYCWRPHRAGRRVLQCAVCIEGKQSAHAPQDLCPSPTMVRVCGVAHLPGRRWWRWRPACPSPSTTPATCWGRPW